MTFETISFSSLVPPKANPRKAADAALIEGLARSIEADGLLQNLVVAPAKRGKFRVIAGSRRFAALKLLAQEGVVDGSYPVPVEIRSDLSAADVLRLATVENVQREPLDPIDEAEAFAAMAKRDLGFDEIAAKTGVSPMTVRRRLALANLCPEAKARVRSEEIPLGIAEAMTLGSHEQQRALIKTLEQGYAYDRNEVRAIFLEEKPSAAMAIFPNEQYEGTFTADLFGTAQTTYFDDADAFFRLQAAAVEALAAKHSEAAGWVEITRGHSLPAWQYRPAEEDEDWGVVINLSPSGRVEVREGVAKFPVQEEVATAASGPAAGERRAKPAYSQALVSYIGAHKSLAVLAGLLGNPRAAKEMAVVLLLEGGRLGNRLQREPHPAFAVFRDEAKPRAYEAIEAEALRLARSVGYDDQQNGEAPASGTAAWEWLCRPNLDAIDLYAAVKRLDEATLDALLVVLPLLSFGQESLQRFETGETLLNRVARDLDLDMRAWWRPDEQFLSGRTRQQLRDIIAESGAVAISRPGDYSKAELVRALARHFAHTAEKEPRDEFDRQGRDWLPDAMVFPGDPDPASGAV